jgi:hypothetical protein
METKNHLEINLCGGGRGLNIEKIYYRYSSLEFGILVQNELNILEIRLVGLSQE